MQWFRRFLASVAFPCFLANPVLLTLPALLSYPAYLAIPAFPVMAPLPPFPVLLVTVPFRRGAGRADSWGRSSPTSMTCNNRHIPATSPLGRARFGAACIDTAHSSEQPYVVAGDRAHAITTGLTSLAWLPGVTADTCVAVLPSVAGVPRYTRNGSVMVRGHQALRVTVPFRQLLATHRLGPGVGEGRGIPSRYTPT